MDNFKSRKILYVFGFYIICVALCQDNCQPICWKGRPETHVPGGTQVPNAASENDCKDLCANSGTCIGIDWDNDQGGSSYGCWFQITLTNIYSPRSINHWDLVNCSDDCSSYCWKPLKNNSGIWNGQYQGTMDENRCKLLCSQTANCTGVDWEAATTGCWLFNFSGSIEPRSGMHHWGIVKSQTMNCQPSTTPGGQTGFTGENQNSRETKDSEDLKAAVIALVVLSGVFLVVIVALAVVLFRTTRLLRDQNSSSNVKEPEQTYDSLQLGNRSQDPDYEQPIN